MIHSNLFFSSLLLVVVLLAGPSAQLEATSSRNHVWDITFPIEKGLATYQQGWHDCRPSAATCTRAHRAVDLYALPGTPVYAAADGKISWRQTSASAGWAPQSGSGYALYITAPGNTFRHFYGHFGPDEPAQEADAFAVNPDTGELWKVGDDVSRGQLLGWVGNSGATGSGSHLHFEIRSMAAGLPLDDPGLDAVEGRVYGDPNATIGMFAYLRYDPYPSLVAAEERNDYPLPPPFKIGDYVRVFGVTQALSVRGPEPCDSPISGAGKPVGAVGRIVGGPTACPEITDFPMWRIRWSDCVIGWSSEQYLEVTNAPADFCGGGEVSVRVIGSGNVTLIPDHPFYPIGSTVQLWASPEVEYVFSHWYGGVSGAANRIDLIVDGDVSLTARFVRTFEAWQQAGFTETERAAGIADPRADPFGSGLPNLALYAFGMGPRAPDRAALPRVERVGDELSFVFTRVADASDLAYVVELSPDLLAWRALEPFEEVAVVEPYEGTNERVRVWLTPEAGGLPMFVRLRISGGE